MWSLRAIVAARRAAAASAASSGRVGAAYAPARSLPRCAPAFSTNAPSGGKGENWVFLGAPGVGKGTYSTRIAKLIGVPHIAAGDLVRDEIKRGTENGKKMQELSKTGALVPDDLILSIMWGRLKAGKAAGEQGFILDGFPRTRAQADALGKLVPIHKAVNLTLREEVLIEKCLGRRVCKECGKGWNVADIYLKAEGGRPEIVMPPLNPPAECEGKMEIRADDTEPVVRNRLSIYKAEAKPVEDYYREQSVLVDFEITGGIPETLPVLKEVLIG